ncbi:MAG: UDP-4-amino-4,6-dideoxy-N-acetyl-beta-L-altrosamine transaminase [Candidatus Omnitrophota bacterium]
MKAIPYSRQSIGIDDIKAVSKSLKSDFIARGPKAQEFEGLIAKYCSSKYAVVVSSGTAALHLAYVAAGLNNSHEVITSPITFLSTVNCLLYSGAKPVFADIDPKTANIDIKEIEKKITKKTKAIVLVHFAGLPCEMDKIYRLAKKFNLVVIEDACHALGAKYKYKGKLLKIGSLRHSDIAVFSFHPVKSITTGEGGAIVTNDKSIYVKLQALKKHGMYRDKAALRQGPWSYQMRDLGFNYLLTDFQCALGINQLKKIDMFIKMRREIAGIYGNKFKDNPYFDIPCEGKDTMSAWHLYSIRLKGKYKYKRKDIFLRMRTKGLGVQVHYLPVYLHPYYRKLGFRKGICPKAEDFYSREISIPVYPLMKKSQLDYVVKKVFEVFKEVKI